MKSKLLFCGLLFAFLCMGYAQAVTPPPLLSENFDSYTPSTNSNIIPTGWDNSDVPAGSFSYTYYKWNMWTNSSSDLIKPYSGNVCMRFNAYNSSRGATNVLKTPTLNLSDDYALQFAYCNGDGIDSLTVRISLDGGATYGTVLAHLTATSWTVVQIPLTAYRGQNNVKICFYAASHYGNNSYLAHYWLDDVQVIPMPTCKEPTFLSISELATNTAKLSWGLSAIGDVPPAYNIDLIKVSDSTYVLQNQQITTSNGNEYILTGLEPNTEYKVRLQGDCNANYHDQSNFTDFVYFTTLCSPTTLPYEQTFEDVATGAQPDCWRLFASSPSAYMKVQTTYSMSPSSKAVEIYTPANSTMYTVLRQFSVPANAMEIEMNVCAPALTSGYTCRFNIGLMSDPSDPSTYEILNSSPYEISYANRSTWKSVILTTQNSLYSTNQNLFVVFSIEQMTTALSVYIDNIVVRAPYTCNRLEALGTVYYDHESAMFSWTENNPAPQYQVEITNTDNDSVFYQIITGRKITGLQESTNYMCRVRAICSPGDTSLWTNPGVTFKTRCAPVSEGYLESFEDYTYSSSAKKVPNCWTWVYQNNVGNYASTNIPFYVYSSYARTGSKSMCIPYRTAGTESVLRLRSFISNYENEYTFRIWVRRVTYSEYLKVYYNDVPVIDTTKCLGVINVNRNEDPVVSSDGYYEYNFQIPNQGVTYIMLYSKSNYQSTYYVDDLEIYKTPSCFKPASVSTVHNRMTFTINIDDKPSTNHIIEYSINGEDTVQVMAGESYVISNLTPDMQFTIAGRVATYCGVGDTSEWIPFTRTFTTPCEMVSQFPYTEGFERGALGCWTAKTNSGYNWEMSSSQSHNGLYSAYCQYQSYASYFPMLISPLIDIPANHQVSFWMYRSNTSDYQTESLNVYVNSTMDTIGSIHLGKIHNYYGSNPKEPASGWYQYTFEIPDTGQRYLIFAVMPQSYGGSFYIDDVSIEEKSACPRIAEKDFNYAGLTHNTITLVVTDSAALVNGWEVAYGEEPFVPTASSTTVAAAAGQDSLTITGLNAETPYVFYVRYNCNGAAGKWSGTKINVRTKCEAIVVDETHPFSEDFESYETNKWLLPVRSCYDQEILSGSKWYFNVNTTTNSIVPHSGTKAIYINYQARQAVRRDVYLYAGKTYKMTAWFSNNGNHDLNMYCGSISDKVADMRPILGTNQVTNTNTWKQQTGYLSVAADGIYTIALSTRYATSGSGYVAIDDWALSVVDCAPPTIIDLNNLGDTHVDIDFESLGSQWEIVLNKGSLNADEIPATGGGYTYRTITTSRHNTITGLTPNTYYYYTVRTICGQDTSAWSKVESFLSECAIMPIPYTEYFEDDAVLRCWGQIGDQGSISCSNVHRYSGTKSLKLVNAIAMSPAMQVPSLVGYQVTGYVYTDIDSASLAIGVIVDPNDISTGEFIQNVPNIAKGQWNEFSVTFNSLATDPDLADFINATRVLIMVSGSSSDIYFIDNVTIEPVSSCPRPTLLQFTDINSDKLAVKWTEQGTATSWNVRVVEEETGVIVKEQVVTSTNVTLTGLSQLTRYIVKVASICGVGDTSNYATSITVRTTCSTELPYIEGFRNMTKADLPAQCFTLVNSGTNPNDGVTSDEPTISTSYSYQDPNSLQLYGKPSKMNIIVLPRFDVPLSKLHLSFAHREYSTSTSYPQTELGVMLDPNDPSTFKRVKLYTRYSSAFEVVQFDFANLGTEYDNYYIAIRANSAYSNSGYLWLDRISVTLADDCVVPDQITVSNVTDNSAEAKMLAASDTIEYVVVKRGQTFDDAAVQTATSKAFTITGLEPQTRYSLYVRAVCSDVSRSVWSRAYGFKTSCTDTLNLPYFDDFEQTGNWADITCISAVNYSYNAVIGSYTGYQSPGSSRSLRVGATGQSGNYIVLPPFNADTRDLILSFYYRTQTVTTYSPELVVGYVLDRENFALTYVPLDTFPRIAEPTKITINLRNYAIPDSARNARVVLGSTKTNYSSTYYLNFDDLEVYDQSACPDVRFFKLDDVTKTTATFTWDATFAANYELQILRNGVVDTTLTNITTTTATVNGLKINTAYTARIRSVCTNDNSAWSTINFKTDECTTELEYETTTSSIKIFFPNAYKLVYSLATDTAGQNVVAQGVATSSPLVINDLTDKTRYYLSYVWYCSPTDSTDNLVQMIKTLPDPAPLPYNNNFDDPIKDDDWILINDYVNYFTFGSAPDAQNGGTRSLYITNDGLRYTYDDITDEYITSFAYLPLQLPATVLDIQYDWKNYAEPAYDYAHVCIVPMNEVRALQAAVLPEGMTVKTVPSTWMRVETENSYEANYEMTGKTEWQHVAQLRKFPKAGEYALVITWYNDKRTGTQPPFAIDNLVIKVADCVDPEISIEEPFDSTAIIRIENLSQLSPTTAVAVSPLANNAANLTYTEYAGTNVDVNLTELIPGKTYYVYYFSPCMNGDTFVLSFNTITGPAFLPFNVTFEEDADTIGWEMPRNSTQFFMIGSGTASAGSKSLYVTTNDTTYGYLNATTNSNNYARRLVYLPRGLVNVSYSWSCYGYEYCQFHPQPAAYICSAYDYGRVGLIPFKADVDPGSNNSSTAASWGNDFINLGGNRYNKSGWSSYTTELDLAEGGYYWFVVGWRQSGGRTNTTDAPMAIDNISIWQDPCQRPSINVDRIDNDTADATKRMVSATIHLIDSAFYLTNISPSTLFTVNLQAGANNQNSLSAQVRDFFETDCDILQAPLYNDFSVYASGTLPTCYTATATNDEVATWQVNSAAMNVNFASRVNATYALTTPEIAIPDSSDLNLRFDYIFSSEDSTEKLNVKVLARDSSSTTVLSLQSGVKNFTVARASMRQFAGDTVRLHFEVATAGVTYNGRATIDNLSIVQNGGNTIYRDTICNYQNYSGHGYDIIAPNLTEGDNVFEEYSTIETPSDVDRITTVVVHRLPVIQTIINDTICEGEVYTKNGFDNGVTLADTYRRYEVSSFGCDSTIVLNLTVLNVENAVQVSICEGDYYQFGNRQLTVPGVYIDTTLNSRGCDSITTLTLNILKTHFYDTVRICESSYQWFDTLLTSTGNYTKIFPTSYNCDSIMHLYFEIFPDEYQIEEQICQGSSYLFGDTVLTTPGTYYARFARYGYEHCDSVVALTLTVTPAPLTEVYDTICDNEEYFSYGFEFETISEDTILERRMRTLDGCDSILRVYVTVNPTYITECEVQINEGEVYNFGGSSYTASGDYTARLFSEFGCDSIVTLHLTVIPVDAENAYMFPVVIVPNPIRASTSSFVQREWTAEERDGMEVVVTSATGSLVSRFTPTTFPIEVTNLYTSGVYYIRITTGTGERYVGKLIVK